VLSTYFILFNSYYPHFGVDESKVAEVIQLVKCQNFWFQVKAILGFTSEHKSFAINLYSYFLKIKSRYYCIQNYLLEFQNSPETKGLMGLIAAAD